MNQEHPFDRYRDFTDLSALLEASGKPLRKCLRVNTLKTSIEKVQKWGKERGWQLTEVPWCREGFFVEREDRSQALGKDLLHLLGHFYIQEASSMLPVSLLDPKPWEVVMDMSAAPGSKTSQMAACMGNTGIIVANDIQEHRLWTLKTALHRLGVINTIMTKKVGQWFARHMTERFDAVLCDAPCTAQGTIRKDSDALKYCSMDNIEKMARLQVQLLESAIHSAKVGGRIVYSTCTLTPEENEGVVWQILNTFSDQVEVIESGLYEKETFQKMIQDSKVVQASIGVPEEKMFPSLRVWPQTADSEGFFSVLFRKKAPTKDVISMEPISYQETRLPVARQKDVVASMERQFGTSFLQEGEVLFLKEDQLLVAPPQIADILLPLQDYSLGLPYAKQLPDKRVRITHEVLTLRGEMATKARHDVNQEKVDNLLKAQDIACDPSLDGEMLLYFEGICIGRGLARHGKMKNNLPRTMILQ